MGGAGVTFYGRGICVGRTRLRRSTVLRDGARERSRSTVSAIHLALHRKINLKAGGAPAWARGSYRAVTGGPLNPCQKLNAG